MAILKIRDENGVVHEVIAIRGEDGKDYVLTDADKEEIAGMVSGNIGNTYAELVAHKSDKENPHGVTAAQVGAVTPQALEERLGEMDVSVPKEVTDHLNDRSNPHDVTAWEVGAVTPDELEEAVSTAVEGCATKEYVDRNLAHMATADLVETFVNTQIDIHSNLANPHSTSWGDLESYDGQTLEEFIIEVAERVISEQ